MSRKQHPVAVSVADLTQERMVVSVSGNPTLGLRLGVDGPEIWRAPNSAGGMDTGPLTRFSGPCEPPRAKMGCSGVSIRVRKLPRTSLTRDPVQPGPLDGRRRGCEEVTRHQGGVDVASRALIAHQG